MQPIGEAQVWLGSIPFDLPDGEIMAELRRHGCEPTFMKVRQRGPGQDSFP